MGAVFCNLFLLAAKKAAPMASPSDRISWYQLFLFVSISSRGTQNPKKGVRKGTTGGPRIDLDWKDGFRKAPSLANLCTPSFSNGSFPITS